MKFSIHHDWTAGDIQAEEFWAQCRAESITCRFCGSGAIDENGVCHDCGEGGALLVRDRVRRATTAVDEPGQIAAEGAAFARQQDYDRLLECG